MTHLCIAMSNFLHSRYLSRTAYLEINASHAIGALSNESDPTAPFRHQGVIYYPDLTIRRASEVLNLRYKYYILDFGLLTPHTLPEFLRCDHRIVLTNGSIWKSRQLDRFAQELKKNNTTWSSMMTVSLGGIKENYEWLYKDYGIRAIPMPILNDPFHITSGNFQFFEKLMKGE